MSEQAGKRTRKTKCTREEVIEAIRGTGGIKMVIASRLKITRQTLDAYLKRWATVREAYGEEVAGLLDLSESVVIHNIRLAAQMQQGGDFADTSDAKWFLARKGRGRGYSDRLDITSDDEQVKVIAYIPDNGREMGGGDGA